MTQSKSLLWPTASQKFAARLPGLASPHLAAAIPPSLPRLDAAKVQAFFDQLAAGFATRFI